MKSAYLLVSVAATFVVGALASCGGDDSETASASQGGGSSGTPTSSSGTGAGPGSGGATSSSSGAGGAGGGNGGAPPSLVDCSAPSGAAPMLKLTPITMDLSNPLLAKAAPDDPDRLYVIQRHGEIMIIENGAVLPTPFLDASALIQAGGEEGLLGLAFHPDYAQNGRFFIHYSAVGSEDSTVVEYKRSSDPHVADPNPVQLVLKHFTQQNNHNGGTTEFGKDGFLYIALGDGGPQGDPECDAQQKTNLLGKISRLDVDGVPDAEGYPAAAGNPDGGKYYHIGFRNPWRMSFDACTFDLYIGDVGQNAHEEVSVVPKADGPKNFGWPFREGAHDYTGGQCPPNSDTFVEPFTEFDNQGNMAMIGGYVYRGSKIPGLRGTYFYGDNGTGRIWTIQYNDGNPSPAVLLDVTVQSLTSFGQDGRGEVYAMGLGGDLYRFDAQ